MVQTSYLVRLEKVCRKARSYYGGLVMVEPFAIKSVLTLEDFTFKKSKDEFLQTVIHECNEISSEIAELALTEYDKRQNA